MDLTKITEKETNKDNIKSIGYGIKVDKLAESILKLSEKEAYVREQKNIIALFKMDCIDDKIKYFEEQNQLIRQEIIANEEKIQELRKSNL